MYHYGMYCGTYDKNTGKVLEAMLRIIRWSRRIYARSPRQMGRQMSGLYFLSIFVLAVAIASPVVYAQQPSPEFDLSQVPTPISPPLAVVGEPIYQENCTPCHGASGLGDGPTAAQLPSPATAFADPNAIWARSPAQLFHTTKFGRIENLMPPWQNRLDDTQIWQAVAYAWSLHTNEADTQAGAELYAGNCADCHGPQGAGDGTASTVDLVDFTDLGYAMTNSQADWLAGWQAAHSDIGAAWTPDQQRSVLEAVRTFSYIPPWEDAYGTGPGVITGTVTQGTPDGIPVAGLTATVEAYASFTLVASFTTTVDSAGGFAFGELSTDPALDYFVVVAAEGIRYNSPALRFTPEQALLPAQVVIYATTDDGAGVQIDQAHWIVDSRPGVVAVFEIYSFGNQGDRTFIGTPVDGVEVPVTAALYVPENAQELAFENGILGGRFQRVGDLVYDTAPVLPGQGTQQVIMRYLLPHEGTTLDFEQEFVYPVATMNLLITELPQLQAAVPGFTIARRETIQGQSYQLWQPDAAVPNKVAVQLTGLLEAGDIDPRAVEGDGAQAAVPTTTAVVPQLQPWVSWVVGGIAVSLLASIIGWSLYQQGAGTRDPRQELLDQSEDLIARIAHLDDRHAIRDLDDATWQQERAQLKAQLLYINTQLHALDGKQ